jgi:hypothetical protein
MSRVIPLFEVVIAFFLLQVTSSKKAAVLAEVAPRVIVYVVRRDAAVGHTRWMPAMFTDTEAADQELRSPERRQPRAPQVFLAGRTQKRT